MKRDRKSQPRSSGTRHVKPRYLLITSSIPGVESPLERIAHFLLEMHVRLQAVGHASENSFEIPLSQEGIGDAVGLSAPHVNRMLSELKSEGLIAMDGREFRILDRAALQILAEFDPSYLVPPSTLSHRPQGGRRSATRVEASHSPRLKPPWC